MTDQPLPMFDESPADTPTPPKKPKPKPTRRKAKTAKVASPKPVKRRKRRATKIDFSVPVTKKALREMSPIEFLEIVAGITMAPWQRRVIAAYLEKDK